MEGLTLRARAIVEGTVAGLHRSPFHGFSVEFAEHREYSAGDDLRYVDWKVYGRTDKFYVKQFEQETNLSCQIIADCSESMKYRGPLAALSKWEYAQSAVAALAYVILDQQDRAGLTVFGDGIRSYVAPEAGAPRWPDLLRVLEAENPAGKTAFAEALHLTAERLDRRGMVILLGDFFADLAGVQTGLKHLRYNRHEVLAFHIVDPQEELFDFDRPVMLKGLEGRETVSVDPEWLRDAYRRKFRAFRREVEGLCHTLQIDYVFVRTSDRFDRVLREYLFARRRWRRGA